MRECQLKTPSFHCSRYHVEASCAHSSGLVRHEDWGITTNERVLLCVRGGSRAGRLDHRDRLIPHALGLNLTFEDSLQGSSF